MKRIKFVKDIPFLSIKKGDTFKVFINTDKLEYIKVGKLYLYLKNRFPLGYFKYYAGEHETLESSLINVFESRNIEIKEIKVEVNKGLYTIKVKYPKDNNAITKTKA